MENSNQPEKNNALSSAGTPAPAPYQAPPMRLYRTLVKFFSGFVRLLFLADIRGRENMPEEDACFVCANHMSNWDPVLVAVAVKRPVHFMAKKQLFEIPVFKHIVRALGAFPVDRDNADVTAIKTAFTHIKHGEPVGIFPQGRRFQGLDASDVKSGTGMMVYRTQKAVIPVSVYTKDYKVRLFKRVYVNVGKPILFDEYAAGAKSPEEYQRISNVIFDRVRELDEQTRSRIGEKR